MVLPASHYHQARHDAEFHLQVELTEKPITANTPCTITLSGRVVKIFRNRISLHPGDTVRFRVAVNRPEDEIPAGGAVWIDFDALSSHHFMEVFLNGDPPDCDAPLWQYKLLDSPSREPQMHD